MSKTLPSARGSWGAVPAALILVIVAAATGASSAGRPVVVFDEGHGQLFHADGKGPLDLSRLAGLVSDRGGMVKIARSPLDAPLLEGATALVVSGAFQALTPAEVANVVAFVEKGGQLGVLIHIEPPQAELLHRLQVSISNGPIREAHGVVGGDALNYEVTRLRHHPLTRAVSSFTVYGAWALLPTGRNAQAIAETSPQAWVDLNQNNRPDGTDARQAFAVAVSGQQGKGRFFVLGDDAALQNQLLSGGNLMLGRNLADWLLRRDGPADVPGGLAPSHR